MASGILKFVGKTAIVTGAGGGLGRHYALELAKRGCNVVVNDIGGSLAGDTTSKRDSAGDVVKEIKALGGVAIANYNSVLDGGEIVAHTLKEFGRCDIVINNAGTLRDKSFHKMTRDEWRSVIDTHLHGTFEVTHAIWPTFLNQKYGRIINIGSSAGLYGNFGQGNYSAAKMAVLGLTNTLAKEGEKHNVFVNCVVPVAGSRMTETVLPSAVLSMLSPGHVASLVACLVHDSSTVNGEVFEVGGGWYSRVRLQRSAGRILGNKDTFATAESIRDSMAGISDFSDSSYPMSPSDAFGSIMQAANSSGPDLASASAPESVTVPVTETPSPAVAAKDSTAAFTLKSDYIFSGLQGLISSDPKQAAAIAEKVNAKIQFNIKKGPLSSNPKDKDVDVKKWVMDLTAPSPCIRLHAGESETRGQLLIVCSDETFISLSNKSTSPEMAYFRGLIQVKGNVTVVGKVKELLSLASGLTPP